MAQISIIIPTYNRENLLPRAIESVIHQTYSDWDLWIIDDGSTDNTAQVIQNYLSRYPDQIKTHFISNEGVSSARNKGIELSSAPWIAFLDSDDEWKPSKLELQIKEAHQTQAPLIHGEEIWIRRGEWLNPKKHHKKSGGDIFTRSLELCLISPSATLVQRQLLNDVGLFKKDFPVCEDYDLWLRITSQVNVGFVEQPILIKYGGHEDQLSHKYFAMDYWRVKSMVSLLKNTSLKKDYQLATLKQIIRKSQILMNGYKKHQNLQNFQEISEYSEWAEQQLSVFF